MKAFSARLQTLRRRTRKSKYRVAKYSGLDQAYILRLENGEKTNPSRDVVLRLALALAHNSDAVSIDDVDELLLAAGHAPLRRWGRAA